MDEKKAKRKEKQTLTIPAFSSLSAENRYHNADFLRACLCSLRNAACARERAAVGSSALNNRSFH